MYPELFRIGGIPIRSWGVMLIIGFFLGYWVAVRRAEKFGIRKNLVIDVAVWALIAGVIGARVGWVLQDWGYYSRHPLDALKLTEGGMTSYGGVAFGVFGMWVWSRRAGVRFLDVLDLLAAPGALMVAIGRIGCFLNGCCYGAPCALPWAVSTRPDAGPSYMGHPAQLYDTLMMLAAFAILMFYEKRDKQRKPGRYAALFLVLYGISRFIYEIFRAGYSSTSSIKGFVLTDGQVAAIVMFVAGIIWFAMASRRPSNDVTT